MRLGYRLAGFLQVLDVQDGRASEASAMVNRMFSSPVTFRHALIRSSVTRRSARAQIWCTVAISRSRLPNGLQPYQRAAVHGQPQANPRTPTGLP